MKNRILPFLILSIFTLTTFACQDLPAQDQTEPWTQEQLLDPAHLAEILRNEKNSDLVIISLGAGGIIPNSTDTGAPVDPENLDNLKEELSSVPRDTEVVLYCGCCPFDICPNVRPAFSLLNEMGFTNHKLLDLPDNVKVDWIDKGYPTGN